MTRRVSDSEIVLAFGIEPTNVVKGFFKPLNYYKRLGINYGWVRTGVAVMGLHPLRAMDFPGQPTGQLTHEEQQPCLK